MKGIQILIFDKVLVILKHNISKPKQIMLNWLKLFSPHFIDDIN